ncbi:hypothetical protein NEFER03_1754 [Nematocida sp. LUAm3]|nr:hypothetical protein NEFER03_1754 [Nematocida sp. LUAm3]KAI5173939.1 hypothetical protein NEFER02_0406 [Nematocida sp. LUAm2]KAI5177316.1 hypothetical protein NEFER01_0591 [Nematocida sp. LUAm1]
MRIEALQRKKKEIEYIISRIKTLPFLFISEDHLLSIFTAYALIDENIEHINKEEYHRIEIDQERTIERIKETKEYRDILEKIPISGLEIEKSKEAYICLITQKEIIEPVEAPCGHVFDKDGLLFFYEQTKKKGKFLCPYVGCSSDWKKSKYNPLKELEKERVSK